MNPNSDLSALGLTVMAVVVVVLAGAWLGLVFFAARQPRTGGARQGEEDAGPARPAGSRPGLFLWFVANIINC